MALGRLFIAPISLILRKVTDSAKCGAMVQRLARGPFKAFSNPRNPLQSSCCRVSPNGIITLPLSAPEPSIASHARLIPPKQNALRGQQLVAVAKPTN
jgi:hypothetical protein